MTCTKWNWCHNSQHGTPGRIARQLLLAVQRFRNAPENPVAPAEAIAQAKKNICLVCDGKKQPPNTKLKRGQCRTCYQKTQRRLKNGSQTEAGLIQAGKLLPAGVGGRKDDEFLADMLADAAKVQVQITDQETGVKRPKRKPQKT